MKFEVGENFEEFERYYPSIWDSIPNRKTPHLDDFEIEIVKNNPKRLIGWRKDKILIGHAIWHETFTYQHKEGDLRENNDKEIIEGMIGRQDNCVELHEIWLKMEFRGKGIGKSFFSFFEKFMKDSGFEYILYYTDSIPAIHICQNRGYKQGEEVEVENNRWTVFTLKL